MALGVLKLSQERGQKQLVAKSSRNLINAVRLEINPIDG